MSIDLVLCATNLSQEEGTAWRSAARLVQALDARVRILHIIEPVTFPYPAEGPGREELREKLRADLLSEAPSGGAGAPLLAGAGVGGGLSGRQDRSGDRTRGIHCPDDPARGRAHGR
jgi:hypothetical protein